MALGGGLPDLTARVRLDTSDLDGAVKRSAGIGAGIGGAIGGFAAGGIQTAIAGVAGFAKGSVDAFAAVEDATGAAGVQFGKALPTVLDFATKASSSFGLSKRAALDAQNTFGTLGKAAGLTDAPLAAFSQKLTGLAGDLASFKGTSTEQAVEAVGAALRGEAEPIRAYGVLLNDASIQAEGLALGLAKPVVNADKLAAANGRAALATKAYATAVREHGKGSDEAQRAQLALTSATNAQKAAQEGTIPPLSATNKTLAIQSLILKQTKDAQGDYQRTSSSTANVQKTLAAETENAQAALGAKLAPAVTALRQGMLVLIQGLSGGVDVFTTLAGVVQRVVAVFQSVVGFVRDNALAFGILGAAVLAVTAPYLASVIAINAQVAAFLIQQAVMNGVAAVTRAYTAVQLALNAVMSANPIGLLVIALALLAAGIVLAWKHSETFRDVVTGAFDAIKGVISGVLGFLTETIPAAFGSIKDTVTGAVTTVVDFVRDYWRLLIIILLGPIGVVVVAIVNSWDTIKAATVAAWEAVSAVITAVVGVIQAVVTTAWSAITAVVTTAVNAVKAVVTATWTAISATVTAAVNAIKAVVMLVFDGIKLYITTVLDGVRAVFAAVWGVIGGTVTTALSNIKGNVLAVLGLLAGIVSTALDAVKAVFTTAWNALAGVVSTAVGAVLTVVKGIGGRILGALGDMGQLLYSVGSDIIRGMVNGIKDGAGAVANAAKDAAKAAFDAAKDFLHIGSPSKLFATLGGYTVDGFVQGITGGTGDVQRAVGGMLALPDMASAAASTSRLPAQTRAASAAAAADAAQAGAPDLGAIITELQALRAEFARQNDRGLALARSGAVA